MAFRNIWRTFIISPTTDHKYGGPPLFGCTLLLLNIIAGTLYLWRSSSRPTNWGRAFAVVSSLFAERLPHRASRWV